ncbi:serine hydrolase [Nevskia sp.]|uniref:serine hydrolase domain-containing protein n=1 Tax=Nevskia sp. TaxID=1929292 RepID=UPI0025E1C582|nr:serine hydrolase domain-containing protein [Nevskia sp.]
MSLNQALDALLGSSTEKGAIPGVIATVADRNGVIYEGSAGVRATGGSTPMTMDTFVWFASMTKAVTAAAAMQLVEQGQLDLDAPAARVLPELASVQVRSGWDANGAAILRPPKGDVTLRNLLTHTSGFAYEIYNADTDRELAQAGKPNVISGSRATMDRALVRDPGTAWEYSIGIDWAGRMVEAASGLRLRDYMAKHIFAPLGMSDVTFQASAEQLARASAMHARLPDGSLITIPFGIPADADFDMGGHALAGQLPHYLRFCRAILNGGTLDGNRILAATTVELMGQNHIGDIEIGAFKTAMPQLSNDCHLHPGIDLKWGLSFILNVQATPEGRAPGTMAWAGLPNAYYWIDRKTGVTVVIATQIMPFWDAPVRAMCDRFERIVYDHLG